MKPTATFLANLSLAGLFFVGMGCGRIGYDRKSPASEIVSAPDAGGADGRQGGPGNRPSSFDSGDMAVPRPVVADVETAPDVAPPTPPPPPIVRSEMDTSIDLAVPADLPVPADRAAPPDSMGDARLPVEAAVDARGGSCAANVGGSVVFCEDFESLVLPPAAGSPYAVLTAMGGIIETTTTKTWAGKVALRTVVRTDGHAVLRRNYAPISDGILYARTHVWVGPGVAPKNWLVLLELQGATNTTGDKKVSIDLYAADRMAISLPDSAGAGPGPVTTLSRQGWFCLELLVQVAPAGANGSVEMFIDGSSRSKVATGANTLPPGGWTGAAVGVNSAGGLTQDQEIFFDDFVLARSRLGCQ